MKDKYCRVLHVGPNAVSTGGMVAVLKLYKGFLKKDFNLLPTTQSGVSIIFKILIFLKALILFPFIVWIKRIKVVHIHSSSHLSFVRKSIFVFYAKLMGLRVVFHIHGGFFIDYYRKYQPYINQVLRHTEIILTVSNYMKDGLLEYAPVGVPVRILYNPISPPQSRTEKAKNGKIKVLFLGTMGDNKGIRIILDCFEKYREQLQPYVELHLGGIGPLVSEVKARIRNGLSGYIYYHGWVEGEQKYTLLKDSHIYLQPSVYESLGIAIIEAMSYGAAIIASNRGGIPDLVECGVNGFLIEPRCAEQLYECLDKLLSDKTLLLDMSEKSQLKSQCFYVDKIVQELGEIYQSLV